MVQMSLRLYERMPRELPARSDVTLEKHFLFSRGGRAAPLVVRASLNSGVYTEDDTIQVSLAIVRQGSRAHGVKKIKINAVQQVRKQIFNLETFSKYLKRDVAGFCLHIVPPRVSVELLAFPFFA